MGVQADRAALWEILQIAQEDARCREMDAQVQFLEKRLKQHTDVLPAYVQDLLQEYLAKCEELNWRMVEIAYSAGRETH